MPLTRFLIRNDYATSDPELYRPADKDDPEALLESVSMSGLVVLLRHLGDLAESVSPTPPPRLLPLSFPPISCAIWILLGFRILCATFFSVGGFEIANYAVFSNADKVSSR
ncbi:hypothetical protein MLD38_012233 [Melastoma candidum]|uniref:Uncharacterized protein n=1 Tax=Melastoma candidum TaxID=119954 RepID=A0ACB9R5A1_9MYRT|nr:hypothetical protein MLD38_012233 [Melastoma candidum]